MDRKIGIGIIGAGSVSKKHVGAVESLDGAYVSAVYSRSLESAAAIAKGTSAVVCESLDALLKREDVDAVIICTPSGTHGEIGRAAARAGKHVIVEKPIEITLEKIDELIKVCRENNVQLHGIYNNRYKPVYKFIKKAIDIGRFGKIINANTLVRWYRNPEYYKDSWHGTMALDGGGTLMNQSIHFIDLLLWFIGDVRCVSAYVKTLLHSDIEAEDTAVASLVFENGALGSIIATTSTYGGFPAEIHITGTLGTVLIREDHIVSWNFIDEHDIDQEVDAYSTPSDAANYGDPNAFSFQEHRAQLVEIIEEIKLGMPPSVTGEEARRAVELILRIYESSDKNKDC